MFKVINSRNIKRISKKNPIMCYYSMMGACGPSGLTVVFFDDGTAYGYNAFYLKDQKLIKDIMENVPELCGCGMSYIYHGSHDQINRVRASQIKDMECIYLGLGNFAYLKKPLYNQYIKQLEITKGAKYPTFREYIQSMGYIDLFSMWHIIEGEEKCEDCMK